MLNETGLPGGNGEEGMKHIQQVAAEFHGMCPLTQSVKYHSTECHQMVMNKLSTEAFNGGNVGWMTKVISFVRYNQAFVQDCRISQGGRAGTPYLFS